PPRVATTQLRFDTSRLFTAKKRTLTALSSRLLRRTWKWPRCRHSPALSGRRQLVSAVVPKIVSRASARPDSSQRDEFHLVDASALRPGHTGIPPPAPLWYVEAHHVQRAALRLAALLA